MLAGDARYAELIAPVVERVFRSAGAYTREHGAREVVLRYGGQAVVPLIMFRHSLGAPGRTITWPQFDAVLRYTDVEAERRAVLVSDSDALVADDSGMRATDHGRRFLEEAWSVQGATLAEAWAAHGTQVGAAVPLLGRLLVAAAETGGDAFAAMWPTYEPAVSAGALLYNRLGILRYHRADAHARAWAEAGLTADGIKAMAPGPERDAIEDATNELAAAPYRALSTEERIELLAALGALP